MKNKIWVMTFGFNNKDNAGYREPIIFFEEPTPYQLLMIQNFGDEVTEYQEVK